MNKDMRDELARLAAQLESEVSEAERSKTLVRNAMERLIVDHTAWLNKQVPRTRNNQQAAEQFQCELKQLLLEQETTLIEVPAPYGPKVIRREAIERALQDFAAVSKKRWWQLW